MKRQHFIVLLLALFIALPCKVMAEADDSTLFMEAFSAFKGKDYLHSIEKLNKMNQLFPDSPLRDIALLMLARSHYRSGDNDLAARTINNFQSEFSGNAIATSVEDDLLTLGKRQKNGEKLLPNRQMQLAAQKVRSDKLALERAAAEKLERERLAKAKAERERIAREKAEAERREQERLAAIKAAKAAISFDIQPSSTKTLVEVGTKGAIPFVLTNHSATDEEFILESTSTQSNETFITAGTDTAKKVNSITLKSKEQFHGNVIIPAAPGMVDGSRLVATVKSTSAKFNDLIRQNELHAIASAPLLRVVSRASKARLMPGEQATYKVTVLNVGSLTANDVELLLTLPQRIRLVNAEENGCKAENEQTSLCRIKNIEQGSMTERIFSITVRDGADEEKLRGTVDLTQTVLQLKQSFQGSPITISSKP